MSFAPTTQETQMISYGTPEAKARIKELKQTATVIRTQLRAVHARLAEYSKQAKAADPEWRSWNDETYQAISAEQTPLVDALHAADRERIDLNMAPLPCTVQNLPAYVIDTPGVPVNPDTLTVGQTVAAYSRGRTRAAVIVSVGRTNAQIAYTTEGAIRDSIRYSCGITVTRKSVKFEDLYEVA